MANFLASGRRRRTNSQREEIAEEQVNVNGVHGEEDENEEFPGDGDNSGIHGDYGDEEDDNGNDEEFYYIGDVFFDNLLTEESESNEGHQGAQNQEHEELGNEEEEAGDNNWSDLVTLSDTGVLDCPICYKPLTIPVFQCGNGHVACPSCLTKLHYICAYCRLPLDNRSRVMERVIESVQAKCKNTKYGCNETKNYSKRHEHEKICLYEPCSCPISNCNFVGSSSRLLQHFDTKHKDSAVGFSYNRLFRISLKADGKSFILQEEKDKVLFILNNSVVDGFGNVLTLSCTASKSDELLLNYDLQARDWSGLHYAKFHSVTDRTRKLDDRLYPTRYLLVPSDFFSNNGQLELDITIWRLPTMSRNFIAAPARY